MKLKCVDDCVREFRISIDDPFDDYPMEARCLECGEYFGCHDTAILKPMFKAHICKEGAYED